MLYVSRKIGANKFGVFDTDDGTEDILTLKELKHIVLDLGLEITGVASRDKVYSSKGRTRVIESIKPYMPPEAETRGIVRVKILYGVEIRINAGCIVSVQWNNAEYKNRTLRLSNFGTSCGADIFSEMVERYKYEDVGESGLTIVIDDKLEVDKKTFKGITLLDVTFDLSGVTKRNTIDSFYTAVCDKSHSNWDMLKFVIDQQNRKEEWFGVRMINFGVPYGGNISRHVQNFTHVQKFILEKYKDEFFRFLDKYDFSLRPDDSVGNISKAVTEHLTAMETIKADLNSCQEFEPLWNDFVMSKGSNNLRGIILYASNGYTASVRRFLNYLIYFNTSQEMRDLFVRFYHKVNSMLQEKASQRGIIV